MLSKKRILITGGTSGIGKELARFFSSLGADVAIFGTNLERGQAALEEMKRAAKDPTQKAYLDIVDVANPTAVEQSIQKLLGEWGGIDVLINN
ncbi:MAG TPA: SDR family NAD(P)-dependent oxidoreductase, partial [Chlamydiales bacterium]|nr:SDR family NAD(P)-dependent oxidoreductase [Chlamydiales bacterium]